MTTTSTGKDKCIPYPDSTYGCYKSLKKPSFEETSAASVSIVATRYAVNKRIYFSQSYARRAHQILGRNPVFRLEALIAPAEWPYSAPFEGW